MSPPRFSRSPDLARLEDEGYRLEIRDAYLVVHDIPYVDAQREVRHTLLVSKLNMAGDTTGPVDDHTMHITGNIPCDEHGSELSGLGRAGAENLGEGLRPTFRLSAKPPNGYRDYHHKVTTYAARLSAPAEKIDPSATPRPGGVVETSDECEIFKYYDTATSRAGLSVPSGRLHVERVALVGLGGTGSYLLDLLAKCPIRELHLFDGDVFYSHNAFRAPGAASADQLRERPLKVDRLAAVYSQMRHGVVPHRYALTAANVAELDGMDFVFLCMDTDATKSAVVKRLEATGQPFIDAGMGLRLAETTVTGQVRVTASLPDQREQFRKHVPLPDEQVDADEDVYRSNIQVAELNALNAVLAVVKWKKLCGFYEDTEGECHTVYRVRDNELINEAAP